MNSRWIVGTFAVLRWPCRQGAGRQNRLESPPGPKFDWCRCPCTGRNVAIGRRCPVWRAPAIPLPSTFITNCEPSPEIF